jgi:hypothetical protein
MSTGSLEKSIDYRRFSLATVKYLQENTNILIREALNHILESKKPYVTDLKNDDNDALISFQQTIMEQFDWMIINCDNGTINYDLKLNYMRPAYYDFYLYLFNKKNYPHADTEILETVKEYFKAFTDEYKLKPSSI